MDADAFIARAVRRGAAKGLKSLASAERVVFLIAEAEADCDMEGIDALLDRYRPADLRACAEAFGQVGATAISRALSAVVARLPDRPEKLLDTADELIKAREGYDDQSVREFIDRQTAAPADPQPADPQSSEDPQP